MADPDVTRTLRERFGLKALYPIQARIVERVLAGGHALVVMPTGSGKSLCYQLPALVRPRGTTLVFSPLIALMEDQVAALRARGVAAQYVNSTLGRAERGRRQARLAAGAYELIYATPERMEKPEFVEALAACPGGVGLLAIDEAHCITKWGHDFRPAYRQVGRFRHELGDPTTIALTATATPAVRADVRATLGLDEKSMPLFATGIDRPNLELRVEPVWDDDDKLAAIRRVADERPGTGIVYFALIRDLERFEQRLLAEGAPGELLVYHGRLDPARKKRVYDRFIASTPGERLLLLATNAFGMGVDKPDIRFIVHAQVPGSVEAYYQEIGRAGRDGRPSPCVLLYADDDLAIQQQFVEWMNPSPALLRRAAHAFEDAARAHVDVHVDELRDAIVRRDRGDRRAEACLTTLEAAGVVAPSPLPEHWRLVRPLREDELDAGAIEDKRRRDLLRLLDVVEMTRAEDLGAFLRDYFELVPTAP